MSAGWLARAWHIGSAKLTIDIKCGKGRGCAAENSEEVEMSIIFSNFFGGGRGRM